ncbi:P-loop containing nucleoside triphosphate hydrolase protein [Dipodascopsis tothii]|uniref:P-loop containing nucleoside triphosphate hydrolase protein n=1 Tax=Dipodascopsis tothii TaxID=44089 RepID=UPI0034CE8421
MLLKAVSQETDAHILRISGPSIVGKYLGDSENALRKIFDEAKTYQPSVIVIDEIDAIAPRRDSDESGGAEGRVVSTLLTLFDSLSASSPVEAVPRVVVVAATNRIASIDPSLRRPGRLDKEIELKIPDAEARTEILRLQFTSIPHAVPEAEIDRLGARTHGFVGADLAALCREAVMGTIERGADAGIAPDELVVELADVETALASVRPSAMREIFLEMPKVKWTDIGGQEEVKQKLKEAVQWPLSHPEAFKRLGISPPKGILLYGPPGCSKTLTAKALATEAGLNFLAVKGPELFNKFVGESERGVREIFRKARNASPSIIFFDEIDALSTARGHGESGGDRVLTSLLNEMDGIEALGNVIVVAATNRPEIIDSALMRPGRLDRLLYVGPPDLAARRQIFKIRFSKMAVADEVDIEDLAKRTDGCSGAEIVSVCQEAGIYAMNEDIDSPCIALRHFEQALAALTRTITPEMLKFYEEYRAAGVRRA